MGPAREDPRYDIQPSPLDALAKPAWMRDALCREYPHIDFVDAELRERDRAHALQVCGRCSVMAECRAYAVADPTLVGIWGGTDTQARRAMRRTRGGAT